MIIKFVRKYIGSITAATGMILLSILTFGDMGELLTEEYWKNVGGNITSIGALSVGLVFVQATVKQGLSEQALSTGLNSANAKMKYEEHAKLLRKNVERLVYLPYFLQVHNHRETAIKRREFALKNNYQSEKALLTSGRKRLIALYDKTYVNVTCDSIKWATTDIVYDKYGRIEKLSEYRRKRTIKGFIASIIGMFVTPFIAGGLFMDSNDVPLSQKFVKFLFYIMAIAIPAFLSMLKEYEKGAFGVPNELTEINSIWYEFEAWNPPDWVKKEVEENRLLKENNSEERIDNGADIQEEQVQREGVQTDVTDNVLDVPSASNTVLCTDYEEQLWKYR